MTESTSEPTPPKPMDKDSVPGLYLAFVVGCLFAAMDCAGVPESRTLSVLLISFPFFVAWALYKRWASNTEVTVDSVFKAIMTSLFVLILPMYFGSEARLAYESAQLPPCTDARCPSGFTSFIDRNHHAACMCSQTIRVPAKAVP